MPRRSAEEVEKTRKRVVETAVRAASVEGLEGLTIGGLAERAEMRKSSVFSLFGSKEELQLAALEAAVEDFVAHVWGPVSGEPEGISRLEALCDRWITYHAERVLPGGCFLTTASVEFDARPGAVRDRTAATMNNWLQLLEADIAKAIERGELETTGRPAELAFELNALAAAGSYGFHLHGDRVQLDLAHRSMRRVLGLGPDQV